MPGFADSFWTPDYATGLGVLYGKLQQGAVENKQIITIASMRADAEEQYGLKLGDIAPTVDRVTPTGFGKDDGASVRKVGALPFIRKVLIDGILILGVLFLGVRGSSHRDGRGIQEPPKDRVEHPGASR